VHRPLRGPAVLLAVALALAGCGGHGKAAGTPTATAASPTPSPSPVPTYAAGRVKAVLLTARQIDPHTGSIAPATPALKRHAVPSCSLSVIAPSGSPDVTVHEFSPGHYEGTNFGQAVLVYPDAAGAAAMFATIRAKTAACPAKRHVKEKLLAGGRKFVVTHDDTWRATQDTVLGWAHVRGFEKDVYPPSSSIINVILIAYDYVQRGNVVVASMYWRRVKPKASETSLAGQATRLLTAQLKELG
jgi:hypothetical protein